MPIVCQSITVRAGRHKPRTALTFPVRGDLTAIRRAMEEHFPELLDIAGDRAAGFPFAAYHEMRGRCLRH